MALEVRDRFYARRKAEPEDAWSSYEIAQAILILMGNNRFSTLSLLLNACMTRSAHLSNDRGPHNITIGFGFN